MGIEGTSPAAPDFKVIMNAKIILFKNYLFFAY